MRLCGLDGLLHLPPQPEEEVHVLCGRAASAGPEQPSVRVAGELFLRDEPEGVEERAEVACRGQARLDAPELARAAIALDEELDDRRLGDLAAAGELVNVCVEDL